MKDLGIPIFHTVYSGHIHDVSLFPTAISRLIERYQEAGGKTGKLVLIFDKGNNSSENIEYAEKSGIAFVGSLVPSHHRDFLLIPLECQWPFVLTLFRPIKLTPLAPYMKTFHLLPPEVVVFSVASGLDNLFLDR